MAPLITVVFVLCGLWVLHYLKVGEPAFKNGSGLILFLVAWNMLTSKHQARKRLETVSPAIGSARGKSHRRNQWQRSRKTNVAIFPLTILLLAVPAAIISVMVVSNNFSGNIVMSFSGFGALLPVMLLPDKIMLLTDKSVVLTTIVNGMFDPRDRNLFSRVTATILAAL